MRAGLRGLACLVLIVAGCSSATIDGQESSVAGTEPSSPDPSPPPDPDAEPLPAPETTATAEPFASAAPSPAPTGDAAPQCRERVGGAASYSLEVAGVSYPVAVHVPAGLESGELAPVVLNWHGVGSTGPLHTEATGYLHLAEQEGFIVVSPTGPPIGDSRTNAWELVGFEADDRDDVAFAGALIDDVVTRFCGDAARVYSTGVSNGGLFTSRLVCELADRLAAASAVAGVIHPDDCEPSRAVPFIAFHGTADDIVPFDGATTVSVFDHPITAAFEGLTMPVEFAEFAHDMGCADQPTSTPIPPDVIRHDYTGCADDVGLAFYEVTGGGHSWPGPALWDSTVTVDATADSWAFFRRYSLDQ